MFDTKYEELFWYLRGMDNQQKISTNVGFLASPSWVEQGKGITDDKESVASKKQHSIPSPGWLVGIPIGSATR